MRRLPGAAQVSRAGIRRDLAGRLGAAASRASLISEKYKPGGWVFFSLEISASIFLLLNAISKAPKFNLFNAGTKILAPMARNSSEGFFLGEGAAVGCGKEEVGKK